jgi:hypothetical protein
VSSRFFAPCPPYDVTSVTLAKYRWLAREGLATLTKKERHAYGEAVEQAILAKQRSELFASLGRPANPKARCASGTPFSDGADIHEAIKQQQRNALRAAPSQIRRKRTDAEWRQLYEQAMAEKARAAATEAAAAA